MPSVIVKPCKQRYKWNFYLNVPTFTSATILDAVHVDVVGDEKVVCVLEKIEHLVGSKFATARRVTGFEEGWIKFIYQGNEIAPELCWKDFGADGEKAAVSVVFKEIIAEGEKPTRCTCRRKPSAQPLWLTFFLIIVMLHRIQSRLR